MHIELAGCLLVCLAITPEDSYIVPENSFISMLNDRHPDQGSRVCTTQIRGYRHFNHILNNKPDDIDTLEYLQRDFNSHWARWNAEDECYEDPGYVGVPQLYVFIPLEAVDPSLLASNLMELAEPSHWQAYVDYRKGRNAKLVTASPETPISNPPAKKAWLL